MAKEVTLTAEKVKKKKKFYKIVKWLLLILLILIVAVYIVLTVIYKGGKFTITLDPNMAMNQSIVLYDDSFYKESQAKLYASKLDFMDNISIKWIPKDIHNEGDGPHNGDNYIAYTFYLENRGVDTVSYWYEIMIDDVVKNVDDAVRIMIYRNDEERKVYAKLSPLTGKPEADSIPFYSDKSPVLEERAGFKPGDIDRYTLVVWLEGDDPECVDAILGGEIKMHMEIRNEHFVDGEKAENNKQEETKTEENKTESSSEEVTEGWKETKEK